MKQQRAQRNLRSEIKALGSHIQLADGTLALDMPVMVKNKKMTLREYLHGMVKKDVKKASLIMQALSTPNPTAASVIPAFKIQRNFFPRLFDFQHTTGTRLFSRLFTVALNPNLVPPTRSNRATDNLTSTDIPLPDEELSAYEAIEGVPPSKYRMGTYLLKAKTDPLSLNLPNDISEKNVPTDKIKAVKSHNVIVEIRGNKDIWMPLTTLTPNDRIDLNSIKASFDYKIGYSKKCQQYFIKPLKNVILTSEVQYTLQQGKERLLPESISTLANLPTLLAKLNAYRFGSKRKEIQLKKAFQSLSVAEKVGVLQEFLKDFKQEKLSKNFDEASNAALNLLLREHKGVCQQRSMLFAKFAEILEVDAHLIRNEVHVFCQVTHQNEIFTVDLGGGKIKLTLRKPMQRLLESVLTQNDYKQNDCKTADLDFGLFRVAPPKADELTVDFFVAKTASKMVVDHASCLHERITNGAANKFKSALF